jgi:hypothetical protein
MKVGLLLVLLAGSAECMPFGNVYAQQSEQRDTMAETRAFARMVDRISGQVKSLGVLDELFASKEFLTIYESPQTYLSQAKSLMSERDLSTHNKLIVGYSMQRLPPEPLVAFLSAVADGVDDGATDIQVLESTAFAPFNFGYQWLIRDYTQSSVKALLLRLVSMKALPADRKKYIQERILTGRAKQDYVDYMDSLGRPVRE